MTALPKLLLLAQFAATLFLAGLIWFVQLVHYPLFMTVFHEAGRRGFGIYQKQHANRTGWVVIPPMVVELGAALAALMPRFRPAVLSWNECLLSAALAVLLWIVTGLAQVPLHNRLATAPDEETIRRLVRSNWIRTALWTARAMLLGAAPGRCLGT